MPGENSGQHETEGNPEGLIYGNSRMAEVIRTHDWSLTPLGPIEDWSEAVLLSANLMLSCALPSLVFWGKELVQLYNDAFIPFSPSDILQDWDRQPRSAGGMPGRSSAQTSNGS